jgi:hypothetical protein
MFGQLLPNKNKNTTVSGHCSCPEFRPEFGHLNTPEFEMIPTLVASQLLGLGHDLVLLQLQLQSFDSMTRTSVVLHCALSKGTLSGDSRARA